MAREPSPAADQNVVPTVEGTPEAKSPSKSEDASVEPVEAEQVSDEPVLVKVKLNPEFDAEDGKVRVAVAGAPEDLVDEDGYIELSSKEVELPAEVAVNLSPAVAEVPDSLKVAR